MRKNHEVFINFIIFIFGTIASAKRQLSISAASIYSDYFAVNDDGSVNLNSNWKSLSQDSVGSITSELYEKPAPQGNNMDLYGVEVRISKDTGIQSVTSFAGYKGNNSQQRITFVAFDNQGKVSSNTLCWDKKS